MKVVIFLSLLIFIIGFTSAAGGFGETPDFGYNNEAGPIMIPDINYSKLPTVNSSDYWITNIETLSGVQSGQFNNVGNLLTIDSDYIDANWCALTGCTMSGNIDMDGNSIQNINRLFLGNSNHWIKRGAIGFNGLSENAIAIQHSEEHIEGTITFIVTANTTNSETDIVSIMTQAGLNNSGGYLGNSWMIAPNNLTINLTDLSNCFFVINATGNTPRISCDTSDTGADLFVQDDIQSGGTMFADGGIRAEGLANFIMNGQDVNIQNGGLHIFTSITFEKGVIEGEEITTFIEDFTGGLGSFTNLQDDLGNWFVTSNIFCDDGDCANVIGISGVGNIIMEANISTVNINSTSLNFIYSLVNMLGADDFEVTVNNNVGSGEVSIFTDATNNVVKSSQSIALPSSMSNQPKVSIRFNCDVINTNRQCFVDIISVNGTAIATTLTNVSGFNSVIKFSNGALAADGFPERGIFYIAENDTIVIRGNTILEDIIEQDLNITNSISLNGTTIFDWAGVVNSPLFPSYLLTNGSSIMSGNLNGGGNNQSDWNYVQGNILNFTTLYIRNINVLGINGSGNFTTTGNVSASFFLGDGSLLTGISDNFYNWTEGASATNNFRTEGNGIFGGSLSILGTTIALQNAGNPIILITDTTNTVTTAIQSQDTFGLIGTSTNHPFSFITNSVVRLNITADGDFYFFDNSLTTTGTIISNNLTTNKIISNFNDDEIIMNTNGLFMGNASRFINMTETGIIMKVT